MIPSSSWWLGRKSVLMRVVRYLIYKTLAMCRAKSQEPRALLNPQSRDLINEMHCQLTLYAQHSAYASNKKTIRGAVTDVKGPIGRPKPRELQVHHRFCALSLVGSSPH